MEIGGGVIDSEVVNCEDDDSVEVIEDLVEGAILADEEPLERDDDCVVIEGFVEDSMLADGELFGAG